MIEKEEIFTDFEVEQIRYKTDLNYTLSQIRIIIKVVLYTSFVCILFTTISVILKGLGVI